MSNSTQHAPASGLGKLLETNSILLLLGILLMISVGGLVEIVPLFYLKSTIEQVEGVRPYTPLELAGRNIRKGTLVMVSQWVLHRHKLLWDEPDAFDPRRFLPIARDKIDRFAYLPFGAGPRICIGAGFALQEAAIVLAHIMRSFTLEVQKGYRVKPAQHITLRPEGGLPVILRRRSGA